MEKKKKMIKDTFNYDKLVKIINKYTEYSESEKKYIINKITNGVRKVDDQCMDNFRFSNGSHEETKKYMELRETGCCGFYDNEIKLDSGKKFIFGFNYGH